MSTDRERLADAAADLLDDAAADMAELDTRLATTEAVLQSAVRATDPDSQDGREARRMLAMVTRIRAGLGSKS